MDAFLQWLQSIVPSAEHQAEFVNFYGQSMRASMFTGFLTLSGFLLSAMTFVVIQMKKEVFEKEFYLRRIRDLRGAGLVKGHVYQPLRNLSRALTAAIIVALSASLFQMTIGLLQSFWAALACYLVAIAAMIALAVSLCFISRNLRSWFGDLDTEADRLILKLAEDEAENARKAEASAVFGLLGQAGQGQANLGH